MIVWERMLVLFSKALSWNATQQLKGMILTHVILWMALKRIMLSIKIGGPVVKGLPSWLKRLRVWLQCRGLGFNSWVGKIPWRREWLPTPIFLPGKFHGQRSLVATVHRVTKSWTRLSG